jgi:hypothetical protein
MSHVLDICSCRAVKQCPWLDYAEWLPLHLRHPSQMPAVDVRLAGVVLVTKHPLFFPDGTRRHPTVEPWTADSILVIVPLTWL